MSFNYSSSNLSSRSMNSLVSFSSSEHGLTTADVARFGLYLGLFAIGTAALIIVFFVCMNKIGKINNNSPRLPKSDDEESQLMPQENVSLQYK